MFQAWIADTLDQQVKDLQTLIRIPSVSRGEPKEGMPLGQGVHDALTEALALANRLGFENTRSLDGYCGIIDYGDGEEMLCIMAHLDVVPAGKGWIDDPFSGVLRDGRIYGRGTHDNKGAAVSALYALAAVKAAGIPMKRRVRIFLGCDEEAGWKCIDRYLETEPQPDLAFTPDADYPVVHSEMGICHSVYKTDRGCSLKIDCGTASNVVPGDAEATLPFAPVACEAPEGMQVEYEGNTVRVKGFGGHAASPQLAKNALQGLLYVLEQQPLDAESYSIVSSLHALLDFDLHGEGMGLDITDESGILTLVPSMLHVGEDGASLTFDCRFPFSVTKEHLLSTLDMCMMAIGFDRAEAEVKAGHFIAPTSELVSTLMDIYEKHVGHKSAPMSIGGGTYARAFENAVAFGIAREGEENCCHMPNESIAVEDLRFNTTVMAEAIAKLAGSVG